MGLLGKMSAFALQLQAELHFSSKGRSLGLRHSKAWEVKGSAVFVLDDSPTRCSFPYVTCGHKEIHVLALLSGNILK